MLKVALPERYCGYSTKSPQKAHMIENLDIFDFELTKKDIQTIAN